MVDRLQSNPNPGRTAADQNALQDALKTPHTPPKGRARSTSTATSRRAASETRVAQAQVTPTGGNRQANSTLGNAMEIAKPDAIVFGESHNLPPAGRAGNFGLISTKDGSISYFGSKPLTNIKTPFGTAALSVVGTNNGKGDEAGVGLSWKQYIPLGDVLIFANFRQDGATVGNLVDNIQGKGQQDFKVSINIGAAYSVSDGVALGLSNSAAPGSGIVTAAALELAGADAWVGAAWRGTATFEKGQLKSVNISGVEIPASQLGQTLGGAVKQQRQSPTLIPNMGSSQIAKVNDDIQLAFGQSPWDVGFAAQARTPNGALSIKGGTVDVRNHGNSVTALTEPVYELGVKYSALSAGQRVSNNQQAGSVIDTVLNRAMANDQRNTALGKKSSEYSSAMNRLMNPYFLSFGSKQLETANRLFQGSNAYQTLTNGSRLLQKLPMLPVNGQAPKDQAFVKAAFQGDMRYPTDNPARSTPTPSRGFVF